MLTDSAAPRHEPFTSTSHAGVTPGSVDSSPTIDDIGASIYVLQTRLGAFA
jgi:hypothetical protein